MIANRNKTLAEIKDKRQKKLRFGKVNCRDCTYSFGINKPKNLKPLQFIILNP